MQPTPMRYRQLETESAVTLEPVVPPAAAVIWLHGLGADGFDFVPFVPELRLPSSLPVRFVFPHEVPLSQTALRLMHHPRDLKFLSFALEPSHFRFREHSSGFVFESFRKRIPYPSRPRSVPQSVSS